MFFGMVFGADFAAAQPTFRDIVVGAAPTSSGGSVTLRMNIFMPPEAVGPTPVVAWIHGGGWTQGSYAAPLHSFAADLLNNGIAVANIGYRLSYENIFPAQINDVKAAIRHLRHNAATYGIDGRRIGAWGTSAGGHLSTLLATSGDVAELEGTIGSAIGTSSRVLAAVDYFGPTDLLNMNLDVTSPPGSSLDHDASTSPESKLIGFTGSGAGVGVLRANQNNPAAPYPQLMNRITLANPVTYVDASDPVMFIGHGTADSLVPLKQSTRLHDALALAGVPNTYLEVARAGHGDLGDATDVAARAFLITELTRPFGDANRDGVVTTADYASWAENLGAIKASWRQGDFTGEGIVDAADYTLWR
jgi:acetyl esterase/lipase